MAFTRTFRLLLRIVALGIVGREVPSRQHFKDLRTKPEFFVHTFVIGPGKERYTNLEESLLAALRPITLPKCLAADAVSAAGPLLQYCRVPSQVVVVDVSAMPVKVYPFLPDLRAYQDFWEKRGIEPAENTRPTLVVSGPL